MRVAVIGGGASGAMAALLLRRADLLPSAFALPEEKLHQASEVDLFEQGTDLLRKVRATGNGRSNITNTDAKPLHYTGGKAQQKFIAPLLSRFDFRTAIDLFHRLGMRTVTLESGMTYPSTLRAETVVNLLTDAIKSAGVHFFTDTKIDQIIPQKEVFLLRQDAQKYGPYDAVIIATGGAYGIGKEERGTGYHLVREMGHIKTPLHPGILSLCVRETERVRALKGIKMTAGVDAGQYTVDDLLFTDYGLSGISILRLSNAILDQVLPMEIHVDLLPGLDWAEAVRQVTDLAVRFPKRCLASLLGGYIFQPVIARLLQEEGLEKTAPTSASIAHLVACAKHWPFHITGTRKKDHGQVTCGGIALGEVDPWTLESQRQKGLYFTGEVLDVQGECGGYNLHWAWTSAAAVASAIRR